MSMSWNVCLCVEVLNVCICQDIYGFMCTFFYMFTVECIYICLNVFMYLCINMHASLTREREREKSLESNLAV